MQMTTHAVTDESFADVLKSNGVVLVDYWAEWCPHCVKMLPVLEEISGEIEGVTFATMDIEANPDTPGRYGVRGVPLMMLFRDGKLVAQKTGAAPKSKVIEWLSEQGIA